MFGFKKKVTAEQLLSEATQVFTQAVEKINSANEIIQAQIEEHNFNQNQHQRNIDTLQEKINAEKAEAKNKSQSLKKNQDLANKISQFI